MDFLKSDVNKILHDLEIDVNLISIPGETDQTDEKVETAVVERRSTAETELDLPTESLGKMIDIIKTIRQFFLTYKIYYRDGRHHH